ncbi:UDP-N-acetylmuramoyl-L-alanine--D-glutamate ligase [Verrucomicrobia bacterium LW23]|nr:UDP-N-acetylmuramoyl-L-alanine--D-glutamate ligase [Verrucomicrobia bacterium LW23]
MNVSGQHIAVLGLGVSGLEAARLLLARGAASVTVRDNGSGPKLAERADTLRALGAKVELGGEVGSATAFDLAILSPGIDPVAPLAAALSAAGVPMIGEFEMASRFCACPMVAITGTNGKTTTTELVARVLEAGGLRVGVSGNIGTPFSAAVAESENLDVMVLEVSSFQLEKIELFRPFVAIHLNLTPDHLDRYPDMDAYKRAKWNIFRNQQPGDFAIVNADLDLPELAAGKITLNTAGLPADLTFEGGMLTVYGAPVLAQSRTHLRGPHNAENQLAALAVAEIFELSPESTAEALCTYRALPHRCERVGEVRGVTYYNDSKATNIDAMDKALRSFDAPVVLIAGGKDKGLDFAPMTALVAEKTRAVVLIGQMRAKLHNLWGNAPAAALAGHPPIRCHDGGTDFAAAIRLAGTLAQPGDAVLLSPGCSSYDMFRSYEDRGDQFRACVQALVAQEDASLEPAAALGALAGSLAGRLTGYDSGANPQKEAV